MSIKKLKKKKIAVIDIEVGPSDNKHGCYLIVGCMNFKTGEVTQFREHQRKAFLKYMRKYPIVMTFNGIRYDGPVIGAWLDGQNPYHASKALIDDDANWWDFPKGLPSAHIDLMNVSPAVQGGLKLQGGRIFARKMQDLPIDPHKKLDDEEIEALAAYNINDLELTRLLGQHLWPQIELRVNIGERYGLDLLGKSDVQMGSAIMLHEMGLTRRDIGKIPIPKTIRYKPPKYIKFNSKKFKKLLDYFSNIEIKVNQVTGQPIKPRDVPEIEINGVVYSFGLGGCHTQNKNESHTGLIVESDAQSLYPSLMIQNEFYPKQFGDRFLEVFTDIYNRRIKAKRFSK